MLVDLCDGRFNSRISADKVTVDHNEVTNLTSTDHFAKSRGFIAEYFIKAPVNITITFPFNVELYRVIIDPIVGRQKSSGFEVFTYSQKLPDSFFEGQAITKSSDHTNQLLFQPVGKVILQPPGVVCFQSCHYRTNGEWHPDNCPDLSDFSHHRELKHHRLNFLSSVSHITIRITRTSDGSAVCLRKLEIWGQPARSCSRSIVQRIKNVIIESNRPIQQSHTSVDTEHVSVAKTTSEKLTSKDFLENGIEIPEEFIDKITCDIMSLPFLLPCGENIDQSTLDKHISAEESWGRPPSDPFTGKCFHGNCQAIPNASLKTRIDQFLLLHSDSLKHLPRTLGRDKSGGMKQNTVHLPTSSKLVRKRNTNEQIHNLPCSKKLKADSSADSERVHVPLAGSSQKTNICTSSMTRPENGPNLRSRMLTSHQSGISVCSENSTLPNYSKNKMANISVCSKSRELPNPNKNKMADSMSPAQESENHTEHLRSSLDIALSQTLGSLPSYTSYTGSMNKSQGGGSLEKSQSNQNDIRQTSRSCGILSPSEDSNCSACKNLEPGAMYRGACQHIMCRSCLTLKTKGESQKLKCDICRKPWNRNDITRVHH